MMAVDRPHRWLKQQKFLPRRQLSSCAGEHDSPRRPAIGLTSQGEISFQAKENVIQLIQIPLLLRNLRTSYTVARRQPRDR